jgi:hypothetical protein
LKEELFNLQPRGLPEEVSGSGSGSGWSPSPRHLQALLRHLLLAEAGCELAVANAAWMLSRGEGAGGSRALGLAVNLLYRQVPTGQSRLSQQCISWCHNLRSESRGGRIWLDCHGCNC